jgi:adenylylsulfate reductase subunit B
MPLIVDNDKCIGCKNCYTICSQDVFGWDEKTNKPTIEYQFECAHCGVCWIECPKRAINLTLPASFF